MTTAWFDAQLDWLAAQGYTTLTADQLAQVVDGTLIPPERSVVLAFDIGTPQLDNFASVVVPRLRERQMRAIFFVLTGAVNDDCSGNRLCWPVLRQWHAEGLISIGSHGISHADYATLSPAQIRGDAGGSRAILEAQFGVPVRVFAYPFDSVPAFAAAVLQEAGYTLALGGNVAGDRSVRAGDPRRFMLPRYYPYSAPGRYPLMVGSPLTFEQMIAEAVAPR
jgi:peptidoglycan/xylan/chitin deacetylase (PgdA/CDA1 family)